MFLLSLFSVLPTSKEECSKALVRWPNLCLSNFDYLPKSTLTDVLSAVHQAQLFQNLMLGLYRLSDVKSKSLSMFIKFARESLKEKGKKNLAVKVRKTRISIIFH